MTVTDARIACQGGDAASCTKLGDMYSQREGDAHLAASSYQDGCEGGDARACGMVKAACERGNVQSCTSLGKAHLEGRGVPKDVALAESLLQKGCDGGDADGCANLGTSYASGDDAAEAFARAAALFKTACIRESVRGCTNFVIISRDACDGGNAYGCTNLGDMYAEGWGPAPRDYERAAGLLKKGCDGGDGRGCTKLGDLYSTGKGVQKDVQRAMALFAKGCDAGDRGGCARAEGRANAPAAPTTADTTPVTTTATTDAPPPPAVTEDYIAGTPQRANYAVIVGIETYRHVPKVPGAALDAGRFRAMAQTTLGIPASNIRVILDEGATKSDIEMQLDWLKANVKPGGRAYFFFSGHGAPEPSSGTSYLVPYNGDPANLSRSGIKLADALSELSSTQAKEVIVFLDTCFSGAGGRSVLPPGTRPLVRVVTPRSPAKLALFTSSSGSEVSGGGAHLAGGMFSHYLIEGLGKGSADIDGDRQVTLEELAAWVTPRVKRQAMQEQNRAQTPSLTLGAGVSSAADISLAWGIASP